MNNLKDFDEFDALIDTLEFLILKEAPHTKAAVSIAEKKDIDEFKRHEQELEVLRGKYSDIVRRLNALDIVRARRVISAVIEKAKQLDINHRRDMIWAKIDNWGK